MRSAFPLRALRASMLAVSALCAAAVAAQAQTPLKIGLIVPMTGPSASTGREIDAAVKLWLQQNGDVVAGRKLEVLLRDDTGTQPETTKRLAQELIVNDKAEIIAGFGLTPLAFAAAPVATQAKVPMIVMAAGTAVIPTKSPYILRTSFTLPQSSVTMAEWAAKNGIKTVFSIVTDYAPGLDAEASFKAAFEKAGGKVVDAVRVPLANPDFAPFVQRAKDAKPDAVFAFTPSGAGAALMKQFAERGLTQAGIKLIGTGDVPDDEQLDGMGQVAIGMITAHTYSAAHPSPENKAYVAAFQKANPTMRPNFMSVGGWDGMQLIAEVLKKTGGATNGDRFIEAAKGLKWTSPRGPVSIEPETRDIVQNIYLRKVEMVDGHLFNVEFATVPNVKPNP